MYTIGAPVSKGTPVPVSSSDLMEYHDIGGYVQEYDANLANLSPEDVALVTDERAMAESVWNKTWEQGLKPFWVRVTTTYTSASTVHLKVEQNAGLAVMPSSSFGHGTFQPYAIPVIWGIVIIVALIVAGLTLYVFSPYIFKMLGMTPAEVKAYFDALNPSFLAIVGILAIGVIGLAVYTKIGGKFPSRSRPRSRPREKRSHQESYMS